MNAPETELSMLRREVFLLTDGLSSRLSKIDDQLKASLDAGTRVIENAMRSADAMNRKAEEMFKLAEISRQDVATQAVTLKSKLEFEIATAHKRNIDLMNVEGKANEALAEASRQMECAGKELDDAKAEAFRIKQTAKAEAQTIIEAATQELNAVRSRRSDLDEQRESLAKERARIRTILDALGAIQK